ncbi:phage tail sheath family protein [Bradyrhizobium sp. 83012]|uniref:Phage tail sheath family protein n=1 Tax=Bradyrhizobium aeschynomenes TaxID=2734909 RepID=A0ABX2CKX5_9BRAD|nr:phage tail sheath C-terminal domain-containing protein [Bradyrhizobium aeschynomenes]NPU13622.1 phage tail sheath family protein [Bradyrhizobium aeschynomenes]NPU68841.1 phage tail sheath family protein [Bradyrhizobium aeschynomenes]NPV22711.1 phage tail sheath family protein [Bradyrhizobium aeschynomenes]
MPIYKTPGVYVEEISRLPPSVAEVSTAIPAFLGYTEKGPAMARISSLLEYMATFGGAKPTAFVASTKTDPASGLPTVDLVDPGAANGPSPDRLLYYAVSHYFANGGGPCYIFSLGDYASALAKADFLKALNLLALEDEPTLIVLTDAVLLAAGDYFEIAQAALSQCARLKDRFTILDVPKGDVAAFRNQIGIDYLSYGAAYHPYLRTSLNFAIDESKIQVKITDAQVPPTIKEVAFPANDPNGMVVSFQGLEAATPKVQLVGGDNAQAIDITISNGKPTLVITNIAGGKTAKQVVDRWATVKAGLATAGFDIRQQGNGSAALQPTPAGDGADLVKVGGGAPPTPALGDIKLNDTARYNQIKDALSRQRVTLPPSAAIAGIYARVDRDRGVWKAPANVGVMAMIGVDKKMTDADQESLNVDPTAGKSINAIRDFTGKGTIVWGARTLAGNDNEWRYVPVRRLFITIEENTRKASGFAVFEPNDATTWLKVRGMIESYLYSLWERGALAGSTPEAAYYVNVGLGKTMTPQDVLEGRLIVEIGIAAVRPAEFIVLRFMHKLQQA